MMELGIYDNFKALCLRLRNANNGADEGSSQMDEIISAALAGGITGYVTNPMDLVKTKMMLNPGIYKGFAEAWRRTVQEGGMASLFNGAGARVSYIMPFCTFYLPVYEIIKRKLESRGPIGGSAKSIAVRGGALGAPRRMKQIKAAEEAKKDIVLTQGTGTRSPSSGHPLRSDRCFVSF
eukprot:CAMPEP_0197721980 /NCGR_PEP_ID=MMETSP1434-20131217/4839_1 /TAXON_ID=265543 /ORGANISM="Minutocellus polymorphus, Strain CCMP3303" /LENGTH=178 /DNA_ID=CAMNT_0043307067 /DNA_START=18 /DNA_END=554 /DNA_ORIENTATION=+